MMAMRIWIFGLALLLLPATTPAAPPAPAPVILVLGDSLSAGYGIEVRDGWVNLLAQRLRTQGYLHTVVNASISGETTAGGRSRLPGLLQRQHPAVVILELGANDGLRGLPFTQMHANLAAMIRAAQHSGARVLLVGIRLPSNYGPDFSRKFGAVYNDLAREFQLAYVPFLLDGVALTPGLMQADGLHPRASGQPRLLENVWMHLQPLLETRSAPVATQSP